MFKYLKFREDLIVSKELPFHVDDLKMFDNPDYFHGYISSLDISKTEISTLENSFYKDPVIAIGDHAKITDMVLPQEFYPHWHHHIEISYATSGHGWYYVDNKIIEMTQGDMVIFASMVPHSWKTDNENPLFLKNFYFIPSFIFSNLYDIGDHAIDALFGNWYRCIVFSDTSQEAASLVSLLMQAEQEYINQEPGYRFLIKAKLLEFASLFYRYYLSNVGKSSDSYHHHMQDTKTLQNVLTFISDNYQREIALKEAAKIACMSSSYFSSFFKKSTGVSFTEYLMRHRISCAAKLLASSNLSITDISIECGFSSLSNFYRSFKLVYNMKPNDFRNNAITA